MRVALIAGGQPRFTQELLRLFEQLQGFDTADLYLTFWSTGWADNNSAVAHDKIKSILPSKYNLVKVQIVDQPLYNLPPHVKEHPPEQYPNVHWAYKRRLGMWLSTKMSFDLIQDHYDAVIKFRPDGMLTNDLKIDKLNIDSNELLFPNYPRNGNPGSELCDQFVVGTHKGLKLYSSLVDSFEEYVPQVCPDWEDDIHKWASEHILAHHLKVNGRVPLLGNYGHILAGSPGAVTQGKNPYTDNHPHHRIIQGII